ncbi:MAG: hypothetical protein GQ570_08440 [Helicobacteraceae bacterium]|nr:hypothetical protein [Helicobacteraceae bacterium]
MANIKELSKQLLNYFNGDKERVKELGRACKSIGFPIGENVDIIAKQPEHFMLLVTYSDLGILGKLADSLEILKKGK